MRGRTQQKRKRPKKNKRTSTRILNTRAMGLSIAATTPQTRAIADMKILMRKGLLSSGPPEPASSGPPDVLASGCSLRFESTGFSLSSVFSGPRQHVLTLEQCCLGAAFRSLEHACGRERGVRAGRLWCRGDLCIADTMTSTQYVNLPNHHRIQQNSDTHNVWATLRRT